MSLTNCANNGDVWNQARPERAEVPKFKALQDVHHRQATRPDQKTGRVQAKRQGLGDRNMEDQ